MAIPAQVRALMRPSAAALEPYDPAFSQVDVNLSANENTYDLPPLVRARMSGALAQTPTNRYPQPLANDLRAELAAWHGVAPEQVIVGNGGDELLFNLFLAFGGPDRPLVVCPPTFSVYKLYAELVETPVVQVPLDPETFLPRGDELLDAAAKANLVVITSPNNPTGTIFPRELVGPLCEACPGIVLLDQAYVEFADQGDSCTDLLAAYPNLAVLRTLSKAFALAGARIGYVMAAPGVISALAAVRQPYSVNVLSQAAALACVLNRAEFAPTIEQIRFERERVSAALGDIPGLRVWPSSANFLLVKVPNAHDVWLRLRDEWSILVRDFSSSAGLADCLRITVGTPEENDRLIHALAALLKED